MFLQSVRIVVLHGQEAAFEAAICEVRRRAFTSPGFRGFSVSQGADDSSTYLIEVRWETADELADADATDRFERCWAPVQPFLDRSLAELAIPALVVHGRRDPFFPLGNGEALAREIPGARFLILERASTTIPDSDADEVATAMLGL
jgi:pimeloyl-ACP methyl ester carboxylesterase